MNKILSVLLIAAIAGCSSETVKTTKLPKQLSNTSANVDGGQLDFSPEGLNGLAEQKSVFPSIVNYLKKGVASWYGPKFHGKKTASGEFYDMYAMTAAHKTLPISSYARVTNLENQRSVIVRINDRGPFISNRLMDLSYAAAKKLDLADAGKGKVEIKAIAPQQALNDLQKSAKRQGKNVYLQVGTFKNKVKALKLQNKIASNHLPEAKIFFSTHKRSTLYKVQVGPIKSSDNARALNTQLAQLGITTTQFVTENNQKQIAMIQ